MYHSRSPRPATLFPGLVGIIAALMFGSAVHAHEPGTRDDFPTAVIADYVLGCMTANGNTYEALQQCSCSIDYIRSKMDYATYERISTIMQVQLDRGQRGIFYRDSNWAKNKLEFFQNVQAESTLQCF